MYKVFINDRAILLTDDFSDYSSQYDTLFITHSSSQTLADSVQVLQESQVVRNLCVYSDNLEELWNDFSGLYKIVRAAGGVVRKDGEILMIEKNKHWDLPKGKIDGNESIEEAAIREVSEECGIKGLTITGSLDTTYYLYSEGDKSVLKVVDWFSMTAETDGPLKGDANEGITDVRWIDQNEWENLKTKSYPSVVNVINSLPA